nr:hypothetical protein [Burkholderia cenocepacia]
MLDLGDAEFDRAHIGPIALRERQDVMRGARAAEIHLLGAARQFGQVPRVGVETGRQFQIGHADFDASQPRYQALCHVMLHS